MCMREASSIATSRQPTSSSRRKAWPSLVILASRGSSTCQGRRDAACVDAHRHALLPGAGNLRRKPYGRSADVWSLGVLFYEILVLRMPFEANSLAALCKRSRSRARTKCDRLLGGLSRNSSRHYYIRTRINDRSPMPWLRTRTCASTCPTPSRRRADAYQCQ